MSGTWKPLTNQPSAHKPTAFGVSTMLLLTDGTAMCQEGGSEHWWRLSPDSHGSYEHGTWSPLSDAHHPRRYYASAVLANGKVFVSGGEYGTQGEQPFTEIYDPVVDHWTEIDPPKGWAEVGDAPCAVLADGRVLMGNSSDNLTALYNPSTNSWTAAGTGGTKGDASAEESWVLLPDGTVVTVQCSNVPHAEKYLPSLDKWVSAGTLPVNIIAPDISVEIGPGVLMANGHAFYVGGTGHTAIYTPPATPAQAGTWTAGPDLPLDAAKHQLKAKDAPGCLLPNGKVLCVAGPDNAALWSQPTIFFEYDPATNHLTQLPNQPANNADVTYNGRMLLLPTGEVLFANGDIYVYTPDGGPATSWRPTITSAPSSVEGGLPYHIKGTQLNGLSQANMYGDDATVATNYPLVRIRDPKTNKVWYCRTHDHSTMGVATGNTIQSTTFSVPTNIGDFTGELCVIANGISSDCVAVQVSSPFGLWVKLHEYAEVQILIGSLADGPLWVLGPHGPIPVPPWGPEVWRTEALAAYATIAKGISELEALGKSVITARSAQRGKVAQAAIEKTHRSLKQKQK